MKRFTVIGIMAAFHSGVVLLTKDQASLRSNNLKDLDDGFFEILAPIQFKRGETLGFDGEVPKALLEEIEFQEDLNKPVEKMSVQDLVLYAKAKFGLNLTLPLKKKDVLQAITQAKELIQARIADLVALGETASPEELAELSKLQGA